MANSEGVQLCSDLAGERVQHREGMWGVSGTRVNALCDRMFHVKR